MKCSKCVQEVMPEIDKSSPSIPHFYEGTDGAVHAHWGFPTYHENKPLCYYCKKKRKGYIQ